MYPCVSHTAPMKEYTHIHVHTHGKHTHANKETHTGSNMGPRKFEVKEGRNRPANVDSN